MLLSIALILLVGMCMSWICQKIKLPGLLGMLATGVVLGPYVLNLLDSSILGISSELRLFVGPRQPVDLSVHSVRRSV